RGIRGGRITPAPLLLNGGSVCDYCQYSSVCRFDEEHKEPWHVGEKDSDAWERLEDGGADNGDLDT
ncbi:MAG: hypothetical protein IJH94_01080, partial [Clostridia bacterium]|nr:hypothetical protein [Clostridia bacterium]